MQDSGPIIVGIDASRNRSGGAVAHMRGILRDGDPREFGISLVHLWAYPELLDQIDDQVWLVKHRSRFDHHLLLQILWQCFVLPREVTKHKCDVLFNSDAGSFCLFKPSVTLSQDMLSFEPGEMARYGISLARMRLIVLKFVQAWSLRRSVGRIFLTKYAGTVIQGSTGILDSFKVIPHGVDALFRRATVNRPMSNPIKILYVSNSALYKHQWNVVEAIGELRVKGYPVVLQLVGGGEGVGAMMLERSIERLGKEKGVVQCLPKLDRNLLKDYYFNADIFVFASSCENLPITLLEAMTSCLPIACSDRGPMPEVLGDAGVYFDPEKVESIVVAVEKLINDKEMRIRLATDAGTRSSSYRWAECSGSTWDYLAECVRRLRGGAERHILDV
jgi:glycosyltransferase involved in cell wall biosynthesis